MARKLEIGPSPKGPARGKDWETLDCAGPADHKIEWGRQPLPFPANTFDEILASHVLEHIPWWVTRSALFDVFTVLKPGGVFEVWVPNFEAILDAYREGTICDDGWLPLNKERDPWKAFNGRLFWGARSGEAGRLEHFHKAAFGPKDLENQLKKVGFIDIRPASRPSGEGHGWIDLGRLATKPKAN